MILHAGGLRAEDDIDKEPPEINKKRVMASTDQSVDWRMLREFAAVDLDKSYALSWEVDADSLRIDVDLFLAPDHPFYEEPRPAEKVCIRPAVIEFPACESVEADRVSGVSNIAEVAARLGHGLIEGLWRLADGRYQIRGEFGLVIVNSERLILRLSSQNGSSKTGERL